MQAEIQAETLSRGASLPVVRHTLSNGLTLLILRREGAPVATFYTQFNIGSAHEHAGLTGVSHLLEHMLKKGTQRVGTKDWAAESLGFGPIDALAERLHDARRAGADEGTLKTLEAELKAEEDHARRFVIPEEYDHILKKHGARHRNATTSADRTNFFVSLPAERAELWFALEADRLKDLIFRDFYRERDVVMEERHRNYETQPWGILREQLFIQAFGDHPYGIPTIGHMSDLLLMDRPAVEGHFRRYYGARNCLTCVVGHVDPDEMIRLAEAYFGDLRQGEPIPPLKPADPVQTEARHIEIPYDAEPHLMVGYHVPAIDHADGPAVAILNSILSEGRSSRLYRRGVVETRMASQLGASVGPGQVLQRLFVFSGLPRAPHTPEDLIGLIDAEIARVQTDGVTLEELRRVQNRRDAHDIRRLQGNMGLAWQLGISQGLWGDWRYTFQFGERLSRVTTEDVRAVALRYLKPEQRTVAILRRPEAATEAS